MNALAQWLQLNELADLQQSVGSLFSRPCARWPEQTLRAPQRIRWWPSAKAPEGTWSRLSCLK